MTHERTSQSLPHGEFTVAAEHRDYQLLQDYRNKSQIAAPCTTLLRRLIRAPGENQVLIIKHFLEDNVRPSHIHVREAKRRVQWLLRVSHLFGYHNVAHQLSVLYQIIEADTRTRSLVLPRVMPTYWAGKRSTIWDIVGQYNVNIVGSWTVEESGEGGIDTVSESKMRAVQKVTKKVLRQKFRAEKQGI